MTEAKIYLGNLSYDCRERSVVLTYIALLLLLPCTPSTHEQLSNDSKEFQLSTIYGLDVALREYFAI